MVPSLENVNVDAEQRTSNGRSSAPLWQCVIVSLVVFEGAVLMVLGDHLGSLRMLVDSVTGDVVERYDYDVWGRVTFESGDHSLTPFGYAGGLYDAVTGLVRFGVRDYDAETGRWTAPEPLGFAAETNWYRYAGGDPVNMVDTTGLEPMSMDLNLWWSKGGNQNHKDTGLQNMSDEAVQAAYDRAKGKDRRKYEQELKARGIRGPNKDRSGGDVKRNVLLIPLSQWPVECVANALDSCGPSYCDYYESGGASGAPYTPWATPWAPLGGVPLPSFGGVGFPVPQPVPVF